jgi:hypothetical protein
VVVGQVLSKVVVGRKCSSTTFTSAADQVAPQQNTNLEIGRNPSEESIGRPGRNVVDHLPTHFHPSSGRRISVGPTDTFLRGVPSDFKICILLGYHLVGS